MRQMIKYLLLLSGLYVGSYYFVLNNNNLCKTFTDYYYPEGNENCYHNPDAILETPELIKKYAGNVEIHEVTSEDGYISTMFRIPRTNPKGVILLHHSIATYSHIYLWQGNDSLAITLWRNGFDVWLANQRGTTYSDRHVNLSSHQYQYWDFSFHEMGLYDVSSELELIREMTNGSKVIYFGHSLGGTLGLVYASVKAMDAQNYLKSMILLTPAVAYQYNNGVAGWLMQFMGLLKSFLELFEIGSPLMLVYLIVPVSRIVLRLFPTLIFITALFVWIFCGYTPTETDLTFFNFDAMIYINNFSWKTLLHFAQMETRFQMYDHGVEKNMKIYGDKIPPAYPVENISVPILMISSSSDGLISQKDNEEMFKKFSRKAAAYGHWKISALNHLDYHIGLRRKKIFADKLLAFLGTL